MKTDNKFHGDFSALTDEEKDLVINPKHYKILGIEVMQLFLHKGMEYMDIMRYALSRHTGVIAHVLGQVFKYSFRLGGKDDELQDATKIAWYGNRLVEEIEFKRGIRKEKPRGEFPNNFSSFACGDLVRRKDGKVVIETGQHFNKVTGVFTIDGGGVSLTFDRDESKVYDASEFKVAG